MNATKLPWEGRRSETVIVCLTPQEKEEILNQSVVQGGISMGEYLRRLHHKAMGRLKEGDLG